MMKKSEIQIFLAHAHEDKEEVLKLYDRLKKAGYRPWLDKKDLIPGQNWRSVIPRVIKDSQLFIACLSTRSISKRGYVQNEFKIALNQLASLPPDSIYFIPLRLDECEIPDLQQDEYGLNLRDIHWLDYWENDGFEMLQRAISHQYGSFTQDQHFIEDLGNGVKLEMIAIPGGKFIMGTEDEEIERLVKEYDEEWFREEGKQHQVTVSNFFMGRYPINQAQWREVAGWEQIEKKLESDPSEFKEDYEGIDRWTRPVESISWEEAQEFCKRLSNRTKRKYRLPTEAEWEYACRAGTTTPFHFGETISTELANYRGTDWKYEGKVYPGNYGRGLKGIYREQTTPIGYFKVANNFGLSDMHGNVFEWCEDDWHSNYENAPKDGSAWFSKKSSKKVLRGGSWYYNPDYCRSAFRFKFSRENRYDFIGFRVICIAPSTT